MKLSEVLQNIHRDSFPAKMFIEEAVKYWKMQGIEAALVIATDEDAEVSGWSSIDEYIRYLTERSFDVMHLPVEDHSAPTNIESLMQALSWLREKVESGKRTVVHCYMGIGRTSTILVCFLMKFYGMNPKKAIATVFEKYGVEPETYSQYRFIYWFYKNLVER
ncbi:MAG: hypothetical protein DRJ63_07560 [Thermoprotei archaeon]|nr:MAG: hypothetical protein DRJ63_07560 [Thermoprotei archaeon]